MANDPSAIVTSHIDGLVKTRQEVAELKQLIDKAASRKEKVPEVVFERVVRDYEARIHALEAEAAPLRALARTEFARLMALHRRASQALERAELDAKETEFRHEVGEFGDEAFEARIGPARKEVERCQLEFDTAQGLRQRFLEVVPDEPAPAEPEPLPAEVPAPPPGLPEGTVVGAPTPIEPVPAGRDHSAPAGTPMADAEAFVTVAIAPAVLTEEGGATCKLEALTSIGRTAGNTIVVPVREVSRNHAQIVLTETGYVLKDLNSGNGTYVNGQRIREWTLKEGDRIQVGDRVFVFTSR